MIKSGKTIGRGEKKHKEKLERWVVRRYAAFIKENAKRAGGKGWSIIKKI